MTTLKQLDSESVHCCITSPPYWGLRDYGMEEQIGLEETPQEFIDRLVEVFREVKRVLREDGTLWVNIGDSYCAGSRSSQRPQSFHADEAHDLPLSRRNKASGDLKDKDLVGIPWMLAFAMRKDGWWLRQDIVWDKPNCMPESVQDRCTKSHEYLFLFSKSKSYFFDYKAIRSETSNKRSVWRVSPKPYPEAHFAVFPPELIEPCVLAGTSEHGCCEQCGSPFERIIKKPDMSQRPTRSSDSKHEKKKHMNDNWQGVPKSAGSKYQQWRNKNPDITVGWKQTCVCKGAGIIPATILDPFAGSGTTAGVALLRGRRAILCELNEDFARLTPSRIKSISGRSKEQRTMQEWIE